MMTTQAKEAFLKLIELAGGVKQFADDNEISASLVRSVLTQQEIYSGGKVGKLINELTGEEICKRVSRKKGSRETARSFWVTENIVYEIVLCGQGTQLCKAQAKAALEGKQAEGIQLMSKRVISKGYR